MMTCAPLLVPAWWHLTNWKQKTTLKISVVFVMWTFRDSNGVKPHANHSKNLSIKF